jgi:hypothetical protein
MGLIVATSSFHNIGAGGTEMELLVEKCGNDSAVRLPEELLWYLAIGSNVELRENAHVTYNLASGD